MSAMSACADVAWWTAKVNNRGSVSVRRILGVSGHFAARSMYLPLLSPSLRAVRGDLSTMRRLGNYLTRLF
jgi:hypothetical protein